MTQALYQQAAGNDAAAIAAYNQVAMVASREPYTCYFAPCLSPAADLQLKLAAGNPAQAQGWLSEAFATVQLGESPVVDTAIEQFAARAQAADPGIADITRRQQDLGEQQARLRAQIAAELTAKSEARDPKREAALRDELAKRTAEADAGELALQDKFPRYAQLVSRKTVAADQVVGLLKPGEGLLYIANVGDKTYSFLAFQGKITVRAAAVTGDDLSRRVKLLRSGLTAKGGRIPAFDMDESYALYSDLVGPLLDAAPGLQRLVFVPTGALLSLPPEVLLTAPPADGDYGKAAWLARKAVIEVMPSVKTFAQLRTAAASPVVAAGGGFVGVGNPDFGKGAAGAPVVDVCSDRSDTRATVARLVPLPETASELQRMAAGAGGKNVKLLVGAQATKAGLRTAGLEKAAIIVFATHGLLPQDLLCEDEPALALTPTPSPDEDGLLTASEIAMLHLDAGLVVLSACNTAGEDGQLGGESLSGLVRAFFFAGSRNVVATHWPIASGPTVDLTTGMMDAAGKNGGDWATALRDVKLRMLGRKETAHPIFWAAFSLVGAG